MENFKRLSFGLVSALLIAIPVIPLRSPLRSPLRRPGSIAPGPARRAQDCSQCPPQTRPVTAAPGWNISVFADGNLVPDFALAQDGPSCLVFDSRGRLYVGTLSGRILLVLDTKDAGIADTVQTFATVPTPLGMAFRPGTNDLYVASDVTSNTVGFVGQILRLRDTTGSGTANDVATVINGSGMLLGSPANPRTDRIEFGPDGMAYFGQGSSTDDGTPDPGQPGDTKWNGTILRFDPDNPQLQIFATGLRNPFGMAFDPVSGVLFCSDEGAGEICQTPPCPPVDTSPPDKINAIFQGGNYGFPGCFIPSTSTPACTGVTGPILQFGQHLTPTSLTFYTGPQASAADGTLNQMLVTPMKRLFSPLTGVIQGGDLEQYQLSGSAASGFALSRVNTTGSIADFGIIDPNDGPVDTAIDPITGDIYVARIDVVSHCCPTEHHNFIYRIHRTGSDSMPFIGTPSPASAVAGSGLVTISLVGRHMKPGVTGLANGSPVTTRQTDLYDLQADLPASLTATAQTVNISVRNPDGATSNIQPFVVASQAQSQVPQIASLTVKKRGGKVVAHLVAGMKAKKLVLVVDGTNFDSAPQVLAGGTPLVLVSASQTELVAAFNQAMLSQPGTITIQVQNSNGKLSNTVNLSVASQ